MPYIFKTIFIFIIIVFSISSQAFANSTSPIILDGHHLSISDVVEVSRQHKRVHIDQNALELVKKSHQLLLLAGQNDFPIYGLNRGVGLNKDKIIFKGNVLDSKSRQLSEKFNINVIHAHSAGIGKDAEPEVVRAAMLIRLNTLLLGNAGVQPDVVLLYANFLNNDITPVLPCCGSIGEADITILSHIGLAMIGEGDVFYKGKRMQASAALKKAHLPILHPFAKDALSIISSNAFSAGTAALAVYDTQTLLNKYDLVVALSLEAINGNIAPFLQPVHQIRPFQGQGESANNILQFLNGSYLWESSTNRALQDPLSFRTASQVNGASRDIIHTLNQQLFMQMNSSDDNPAVIFGLKSAPNMPTQQKSYYVKNGNLFGAVIPTANFDPINWVLQMEELEISLNHLSISSTQRISRLESDCFTKLSRFLASDETSIAFGAIQKPVLYLNSEIQQLSVPISPISFPVAGDIEDTSTNALLVVQHLNKIIDELYRILGIELIHSNQAVDLRKREFAHLKLGLTTNDFHKKFRQSVNFLNHDRVLTTDINNSYKFIKQY